MRSFFAYDKHAGINALFDSRSFLEAEQSFSHMLRLDIAKCFESIYTHSIEWSVYGRSVVKSQKSSFDATMPREFDKLMMAIKEEETNGLLIGPEVSRVFAELVLQGVDLDIERDLNDDGVILGDSYMLFRYVDDYFLFYNDAGVSRRFRQIVDARLHDYGLHVNESKTLQVRTPHLTPLSVAKARIREASARLKLRVTRTVDEDAEVAVDAPGPNQLGSLIAGYKMALAETGVAPEDIANYALVLVEEQVEAGVTALLSVEPGSMSIGEAAKLYDRVCDYLSVALEYAFFVFAGSGRASAAVKAARIAALAVRTVSELGLPDDRKEHVKQVIFEEARRVMRRHPLRPDASLESLYMLDVISFLGSGYRLTLDELVRFSGATRKGLEIVLPDWMHSMVAMTLLRNVGSVATLAGLATAITEWALARVQWMLVQETDHAERVILVMDLLSSPYVSRGTKVKLLDLHQVKHFGVDKAVEASGGGWFTNWSIGDLHAELLLKRSQHVY
ncbi:MAG: RNA-directed DNA polymerase [Microbacterium sp.]|nr:RNA-directed DNA polymerase [Microbacterium sp.]MCV0376390.1 RNA-directed DNA polymerase [Microbacterium sp.]MCV0389949.1 RNA-directed DNA polymerase [Microbacterium sp.]MCV0419484.1 RNA-directed DNA polymerase [Microbacterium sp.]MCV0421789.1 RNA-directed DNA polymerase [Microbacterium sp.]